MNSYGLKNEELRFLFCSLHIYHLNILGLLILHQSYVGYITYSR